MLRKIIAALAISFAAVGGAVALPAAAHAAPTTACTGTGYYEIPKIIVDQYGNIHVTGYYRNSYVGTATGLLTSLRIWHVSYKPSGSSTYGYHSAYAAACTSAGEQTNTIDLTRDEDEKLTSFDLRCGTTNFTSGSTTYTYVASRNNSGDTFRYWGTRYSGLTFFGYGVTAARCE
ncbi:MAG TPA: hypothetical protein VF062_24490 [Candidatus Limnocylindrales bacterium]